MLLVWTDQSSVFQLYYSITKLYWNLFITYLMHLPIVSSTKCPRYVLLNWSKIVHFVQETEDIVVVRDKRNEDETHCVGIVCCRCRWRWRTRSHIGWRKKETERETGVRNNDDEDAYKSRSRRRDGHQKPTHRFQRRSKTTSFLPFLHDNSNDNSKMKVSVVVQIF